MRPETLKAKGLLLLVLLQLSGLSFSQQSVAREWNNILLEAIRNDYARPTVHARNLYHHSIIVYDSWAAFDQTRQTFLLGDTLYDYICSFDGIPVPIDVQAARHAAISYASYKFIRSRYANSPNFGSTITLMNNYMSQHGYDITYNSTDYLNDGAAALGNYLAQEILNYGLTDGSNEIGDFNNIFYTAVNPPLAVENAGNPDIIDPNHWQPLSLTTSIDQAGNPVAGTLPFLSPEWGTVEPFSLEATMYNDLTRDGNTYRVYFDSVQPAWLDLNDSSAWDSFYKWNHSLVSIWQSHLDTTDGVMWDISPASIGNNTWYPIDSSQYSSFYNLYDGGDPSTGYSINPVTGLPYVPQIVHRADYARVLAEFWADGIDSETPPGHWFEIYHYVSDQPAFERKWQGLGDELDALEYDVKAHLTLGGAMHDAAISAWSLKGYYDYLRPVSAIRYLSDQGQSSDSLLPNYSPLGIPLEPGYIEIVDSMDALAGVSFENVGKIKLYTWRGHEYITNTNTDMAGVGWILAENWWPYQRPTFVTPPFAGFVSGHSTFSRAAAGILEYMTGSPYFPGGLGEFLAVENDFLQFEEGPSSTIVLQWASYRDAADQCSLSRIWGGIHPPVDDIPGRRIGEVVGLMAFDKADSLFSIQNPALIDVSLTDSIINILDIGNNLIVEMTFNVPMDTSSSPAISFAQTNLNSVLSLQQPSWLDSITLQLNYQILNFELEQYSTDLIIDNLTVSGGNLIDPIQLADFFLVDTKSPVLIGLTPSETVLTDDEVAFGYSIELQMSETCNSSLNPLINFSGANYTNSSLNLNQSLSEWNSDSSYVAFYNVIDFDEEVDSIFAFISNIEDSYGNPIIALVDSFVGQIDTKNPKVINIDLSDTLLNINDQQSNPLFDINVIFDEQMDTSYNPVFTFYNNGVAHNSFIVNPSTGYWIDSTQYIFQTQVLYDTNNLIGLDLACLTARDLKGNSIQDTLHADVAWSDMKRPTVTSLMPNRTLISDSLIGNGQYYIDILFDEPMDLSALPLSLHSSSSSLSGSIQYNPVLSYFIDSMNYRAVYNVIDENIEIDSIDVNVQFGADFAQNSQEIYSANHLVELDTKNPSILGIYGNTNNLNSIGEQLEIGVIFDENMSLNQPVNFVFTPQIATPVILTQVNYIWQSPSYLTSTYELQAADIVGNSYGLVVENGTDEAGNLSNPSVRNDLFTIAGIAELKGISQQSYLVFPTVIEYGDRINISGLTGNFDISIFDSAGKEIYTDISKDGENHRTSPLHLSSGLYYIKINDRTSKIISK